MKILIDECLPDELKGPLTVMGYECQTVRRAGFGSEKNGELLTLAEGRWDVMVTSDRNIKYRAEYGGSQNLDPNSLRKIESNEGFAAAHASLCGSSSLHPARSLS